MSAEYSTRRKLSGLPVQLVTVGQLRSILDVLGGSFMVILVPVEGGYVFRSEPIYRAQKCFEIKSEKSGKRRVFKSVESALRLARSVGFATVQVELGISDPQGDHSRLHS